MELPKDKLYTMTGWKQQDGSFGGIIRFQDDIKEILSDGRWRSRMKLRIDMGCRGWRFTFPEFKEVMDELEAQDKVRTMLDQSDTKLFQNPLPPQKVDE